jgi:Sec-independent protein translocase protein TatA
MEILIIGVLILLLIAKEKFKEENDDYWKFVTYLTKRQCNESLSFKEFLNNKC